MKKLLTIGAVILLVAGIGLSGFGVWQYYLREEQALCGEYTAGAIKKLNLAKAAAGTPQEQALKSDADDALAGAQSVCQIARESKQNGMMLGLGGFISIIISIALLFFLRRANK